MRTGIRILLVGLLLVNQSCGGFGMDEMLKAAYDFDKASGRTLKDTTPNGNDGTIFGAEWAPAASGHTLVFDGIDDYVNCGEQLASGLGEPFSIEAWVYPAEIPVGEVLIAGNGGYTLTYGSTGRFWLSSAPVKRTCRARAPARLWHHVVGTVDGNTLRIYIDGALAGGVRNWQRDGGPSATDFFLGGGLPAAGHFKGMMDGVRIYGRALSPREVLDRYLEGKENHPAEQPRAKLFSGPGVKPLNNLVAELRCAPGGSKSAPDYSFHNPREGWVFFSLPVKIQSGGRVSVSLGKETIMSRGDAGSATLEAMRYLPAGRHTLAVRAQGKATPGAPTVRAIPELIYGLFQSSPNVSEYDDYTWDFLSKDVIPNVNCLAGPYVEKHRPIMDEWRRQGKRWVREQLAPWTNPRTGAPTASTDEMYELFLEMEGLRNPALDGVLLDTFDVGRSERYEYFTEAVRRLRANVALKDKIIYHYCDTLVGAPDSEMFAREVIASGYHPVWTRYMAEQPTEDAARTHLQNSLAFEAANWEKYIPGSIGRMVMGLGYLSAPPETMNVEPGVNYLYYMDMQCNLLANDPAFAGLYGVMWYKSSYADEEAVRWAGRLFRHYFIEGRKEMLSGKYGFTYSLNHIANPNFENGTLGWEIQPATDGSISTKHINRYGFLLGNWLEMVVGDNVLSTRRSDEKPNVFSQTIRNLKPGKLYALKLHSADYGAMMSGKSVRQKLPFSITIENADLLPEKCFDHVYSSISYHHLGPNDETEPPGTWLNFHRRVFRAGSKTAKLVISDWVSPDNPGGPVGQELVFNFVEVQPYLEY